MEYRGKDAFIDEVYIAREWRGRGFGRRALHLAEQTCLDAGVRAIHLEVERGNEAQQLYETQGFVDGERHLMTKRLPAEERPTPA